MANKLFGLNHCPQCGEWITPSIDKRHAKAHIKVCRRKSRAQLAAEQVRATYPDTYIVPGLGWCGPNWQDAQTLYTTLIN